jgi:hypothetical protein
MKFYSTIIALCAISSAAAFNIQGPKGAPAYPATALQESSVSEKAATGYATAAAPKAKTAPPPVTVQGGSLQTWSFATPAIERVQVLLKTEGRPLNANVELWQGPDNTPQKIGFYSEDGDLRPINVMIETPRENNAIAIRNTGHLEFPLAASVEAHVGDANGIGAAGLIDAEKKTIQGGAIHTIPFAPNVASVQVMLKTDGRPLKSRVELLQGPNNKKQVIDIYTEDGLERPFFVIIETPGPGNVVRVVNTATVEFPLTASVEPYEYESSDAYGAGGNNLLILDRK